MQRVSWSQLRRYGSPPFQSQRLRMMMPSIASRNSWSTYITSCFPSAPATIQVKGARKEQIRWLNSSSATSLADISLEDTGDLSEMDVINNEPVSATTPTLNPNRRLFQEDAWNDKFQQLVAFQHQYGHANVPRIYPENPSLGIWVQKQRREYQLFQQSGGQLGAITQERIQQLESLKGSFQWSVSRHNQEQWLDMWEQLRQFQAKYVSTKVPILDSRSGSKRNKKKKKDGNKENDDDDDHTPSTDPISRLGRWVRDQRSYYNRLMIQRRHQTASTISTSSSPMTDERVELLEEVGFEWSGRQTTAHDKWLHQYFKLYYHFQQQQQRQEGSGTTGEITAADGQYGSLAKWIERQRKDNRNGKLSAKQIELLDEIQFDWNVPPRQDTWDDFFQELQHYHDKYQSTLVCAHVDGDLGKWTTQQRRDYRKGVLSQDRIDKLNQLGFDWDAADVSWNAMADRLLAYQRRYGTMIVPAHNGHDRPLAHWVIRQRNLYLKYMEENDEDNSFDLLVQRISQDIGQDGTRAQSGGPFQKLSPEIIAARICRLMDMGFVWDPLERQWLDIFERLKEYRMRHQSTLVPKNCELDPQLGEWVQRQRKLYNKQDLSQKRIDRLNSIDFVWDPQQEQWLKMIAKLKEYQKKHGTTMVPSNYADDPELGYWVSTQRKLYRRNALSQDRLASLEDIGFVWNVRSNEA
jgi:Helicase associated domain